MNQRLKAIHLLIEAAKDLKRQGSLSVWGGQMIIQVPFMRLDEQGRLTRVNRLQAIWLGWRRR